MGLLGRKITYLIAGTLAGFCILPISVQAKGNFDLSYEKPEGEYYMLSPMQEERYEVKAGDSLWKIAERLWGDGKRYVELYEANREEITDPDLIWPGQILRTGRPLYLERQDGPMGFQSGSAYQFDTPRGCTAGLLSLTEASAKFTLFGKEERYDIACLIREKDPEKALKDMADCEAWEKAVSAYVMENYGSVIQDLEFEYYRSEKGEPVCLYSYTYMIDLSKYGLEGSEEAKICAGITQSENIQAEFVGFAVGGGEIRDRVRYVTASFEELLPEGEECHVNEENMQISPSVSWEPVSFNAVAWIDRLFDDMFQEITGYREEHKSRKEKILDQMKEGNGM